MFFIKLIFYFIIVLSNRSWSKERRELTFINSDVKVCGKEISWIQLLPNLSISETECFDSYEKLSDKGILELNSNSLQNLSSVESKPLSRPFYYSINKEDLVTKLKKIKTTCLNQSGLKIPSKIKVHFISKLSLEVFEEWIKSELKVQFPDKKIVLTNLYLPKIDCSTIILIRWGSMRIESPNTYRFLLVADDKNYGVSGEFKVIQSVPVAKRNINPLEKLTETDLEYQEKDITFSSGYATKMEDLTGKTVLKPVMQGQSLTLDSLKKDFLVEKGQIIVMQFEGSNFLLSTNGIAEQNGVIGDLIKIKNMETQKILSGVVKGKGMVEIK